MNENAFFSQTTEPENMPVSSINPTFDNDGGEIYTNIKSAVKTPKIYTEDFFITIRASDLRKARSILKKKNKGSSRLFDVLLALTFMLFGVFIGSFVSTGTLFDSSTIENILSTIISPIIGTATGVGAYFTRKISNIEIVQMANEVLKYLVDPDNTESGEEQ